MPRWLKQSNRLNLCLALLVLTSLLTGCISLQAPKPSTSFQAQTSAERNLALKQIQCWTLRGALSISSAQGSQIAHYTWSQKNQSQWRIKLASSLNVYQVQLQRQGNHYTLISDPQHSLHASSPEALMQQTLGYSLPVAPLGYWIRGLAAPGNHQAQWDEYGHLKQLKQQGWTVSFLNYAHQGKVDLPHLIQLQHQKQQIRLKLVIKQWDLNCPSH